jgi:hypothetical protein
MPLCRNEDDVLTLIHDEVIGRRIVKFEIFGINSLKTVAPEPSALAGEAILSASFDAQGRLHIQLQNARLEVDLARTGGLDFGSNDDGGTRPTARVSFADGTRLDFREPAKTKRITFSLWRT